MIGVNFRLLPLLLFFCFEDSLTQTVQDVTTYTTKQVEELKCNFTSSSLTVQWTEQLEDGSVIVLFSYDTKGRSAEKQTSNTKYENFNYSIEGTSEFNLLMTNVDKDDGGKYQCIPFLATTVTFTVTVEVLPASININCTDINVCMSSAEKSGTAPQIVCICMVTGVSSRMVEIEWKGVSFNTISNTTRDMDPTSGTFSISSEATFPPSEETSSLSCSLTGYKSQIPERLRSLTYTFSPPACNLIMQECSLDGKSALLICNCTDGSPELNGYTFYNSKKSAIGTQFSGTKNVQVEPNRIETFYCSGCNGLMHSQTVEEEFRCQQGSNWWILIVILILLVSAIIVFVLMKRLKGDKCCWASSRSYRYETPRQTHKKLSAPNRPQEKPSTPERHQEKPSTPERSQGDGEEIAEEKLNAEVDEDTDGHSREDVGTEVDSGMRQFISAKIPPDNGETIQVHSSATKNNDVPNQSEELHPLT